jgi:hypothetical protein
LEVTIPNFLAGQFQLQLAAAGKYVIITSYLSEKRWIKQPRTAVSNVPGKHGSQFPLSLTSTMYYIVFNQEQTPTNIEK